MSVWLEDVSVFLNPEKNISFQKNGNLGITPI